MALTALNAADLDVLAGLLEFLNEGLVKGDPDVVGLGDVEIIKNDEVVGYLTFEGDEPYHFAPDSWPTPR